MEISVGNSDRLMSSQGVLLRGIGGVVVVGDVGGGGKAQTAREPGKSPNIRKLDKPNLKFSVIRLWIFAVGDFGFWFVHTFNNSY